MKLLGDKPLTAAQRSLRWRETHPDGQQKANERFYRLNKKKLLAGKYKWYRENREEVLAKRRTPEMHRKQALRRYRISPEWYDERMRRGCFICGGHIKLGIDHDHRCCPEGKACGECVREVLCAKCNAALGLTGENMETLQKLIAYISLFKKTILKDEEHKGRAEE